MDATGNQGNDHFAGGDLDDILRGGDGHDTLYGNGGADIIDGGAGNDSIRAGEGDDEISTGSGNDTVFGGAGLDTVTYDLSIADLQFETDANDASVLRVVKSGGSLGTDTLRGVERIEFAEGFMFTSDLVPELFDVGLEPQTLHIGTRAELPVAPAAFAHLAGMPFTVTLLDGAGGPLPAWINWDPLALSIILDVPSPAPEAPAMIELVVNDTNGGEWRDTIQLTYEVNPYAGGDLNDVLVGDDTPNSLIGAAGDDTLTGNAGDDLLDGGPGRDTADYSVEGGGSGILVDLEALNVTDSFGDTDTLADIEVVVGTGFADEMVGAPTR